jgi:hypothetical protein
MAEYFLKVNKLERLPVILLEIREVDHGKQTLEHLALGRPAGFETMGEKMSKQLKCIVIFLLCLPLTLGAQGNTFDKIRYQGGTLQTKVDPDEWENNLTVTSDAITLKLKDGQTLVIDPSKVTALGYGQEAHRRVGTMIALGILLAPVALFGLFHKTRKHYVSVEFQTNEGKKSAVLLQADKDNYRAVLVALKGTTGRPIAVAEEDRKYIPVGVEVDEVKASDKNSEKDEQTSKDEQKGTVKFSSEPSGAEIYVDDSFVGNTPAALKLVRGTHKIRIAKKDYKDWEKVIKILPDSEISLNISLNSIQ